MELIRCNASSFNLRLKLVKMGLFLDAAVTFPCYLAVILKIICSLLPVYKIFGGLILVTELARG